MFNYSNKDTILQQLINLSREITTFVALFSNIDDTTYLIKVMDLQSKVNTIVGYSNSYLASRLSSQIMILNFDKNKSNAMKLLEISNLILNIGREIR